jgi:hypothetical protein
MYTVLNTKGWILRLFPDEARVSQIPGKKTVRCSTRKKVPDEARISQIPGKKIPDEARISQIPGKKIRRGKNQSDAAHATNEGKGGAHHGRMIVGSRNISK